MNDVYKKEANRSQNLLIIWLGIFLVVVPVMYIGIWDLRSQNEELKQKIEKLEKENIKLKHGPVIYSF